MRMPLKLLNALSLIFIESKIDSSTAESALHIISRAWAE